MRPAHDHDTTPAGAPMLTNARVKITRPGVDGSFDYAAGTFAGATAGETVYEGPALVNDAGVVVVRDTDGHERKTTRVTVALPHRIVAAVASGDLVEVVEGFGRVAALAGIVEGVRSANATVILDPARTESAGGA